MAYSTILMNSLAEGVSALQKGQELGLPLFVLCSWCAWLQPQQIILPQHALKDFPIAVLGNITKQIGQSSPFGGCLNSSSSCNSAARFLHALLCWGRCEIWQPLPQYFTSLHAGHAFSFASVSSALPQLAHDVASLELATVGVGPASAVPLAVVEFQR